MFNLIDPMAFQRSAQGLNKVFKVQEKETPSIHQNFSRAIQGGAKTRMRAAAEYKAHVQKLAASLNRNAAHNINPGETEKP